MLGEDKNDVHESSRIERVPQFFPHVTVDSAEEIEESCILYWYVWCICSDALSIGVIKKKSWYR